MKLFANNRKRLCKELRKIKNIPQNSIILLQGGEQTQLYSSDTDLIFRQVNSYLALSLTTFNSDKCILDITKFLNNLWFVTFYIVLSSLQSYKKKILLVLLCSQTIMDKLQCQ